MSVQLNTYVMRGVLLPFDNDKEYEKYEPYFDDAFKGIHHHEGLCVLSDGMNGRYMAIGQVIAKTANYEGFNEPIVVTKPDLMQDLDLANKIAGLIGDHPHDINTFVISHYR